MALAVETLKVVRPPPVPHMSVRFPSTLGWIWTQLSRMARAMAATSSTVGPFMSEGDEEAGDLHVGDLVVPHGLDELGQLLGRQVLLLGQLAQRVLEHGPSPWSSVGGGRFFPDAGGADKGARRWSLRVAGRSTGFETPADRQIAPSPDRSQSANAAIGISRFPVPVWGTNQQQSRMPAI